jgi:hypothetical protein
MGMRETALVEAASKPATRGAASCVTSFTVTSCNDRSHWLPADTMRLKCSSDKLRGACAKLFQQGQSQASVTSLGANTRSCLNARSVMMWTPPEFALVQSSPVKVSCSHVRQHCCKNTKEWLVHITIYEPISLL